MSLNINSQSAIQTNTESAVAIKTAQKAKSQQEIEGQMAMKLIETAAVDNVPAPQGNAGNNINIKV